MKKRSVISLSLCLTLLFSLLSNMLAGAAFAKESRAAIVVSVKGTVMVTKAGGSTEYRAFDEMSLNQGDHIRTEDESSIVLQVVDQEDEVTIGPNTEMYISSLLESDEGGKKSKLKVWAGSLWFKVKKLVNADDEFEVETPTAVMSVRGSNGYIETMYGQLFAMMTSGVLETTTSGGDGSSDSIHISPGQQIQQSGDQPGDLAENVTPLDIKSFVANASPDIIIALLTSIQEIREENEQFVQDLGSGTKSVDSRTGLNLGTTELQQQFGSNLTNLLANVAKEAIDSNKLPAGEVNELVAKANEGVAGERIDLSNVKPFDPSVGLNPDVQKAKEEQLQRQQELRQASLDREKQQQLDKISQNQSLADRLAAERQRQEQGNANAKNEEQQRTNETFQQQGGTGNNGGTSGGNTSTPGGNTGGGNTGGGNTGGGNTGGGNTGGVGTGGEEQDSTPPELAIAHPTTQPYLVNAALQEVSVYAEQGSTVTIFKGDATAPLDTKTGLGANTKVTFTVTLAEGANTFKVTATDSSGNATTKTATLELDTVSPALTIGTPASEVTIVNTKPQNIALQAEQGASLGLYKGDATTPIQTGTGAGATNVIFVLNDLAEGDNSYKITATDAAGNVATKTLKYVLNTSAPGLSIKHPTLETNTVKTKPQTIEVEVAQGITVSLYKDGSATPLETKLGSGTSNVVFTIDELTEGTNVFKVTAADTAGNTASQTVTYVLDTVAPNLAISHPANEIAYVNAKPQNIVLQAEQGALVSLYKGNATIPLETAPGAGAANVTFTLHDLSEGENSYKVTATDAAGNATTKTVKYVLNTSAPELSIQHPAHETNVVRTKPQTIEVRAAQGIMLSLYIGDSLTPLETKQSDGTTNVVFTIQELAEGLNTFKVTARDAAGNTASQTVNYVLDTLAPLLAVSHPANEVTYVNSKPQSIVWQAEQGVSVSLYKGNAPTPIETATGLGEASITFAINDLIEGTNTYSIVAIDEAGNVTSKTVHYVLITSGPSLAIVHPYSEVEDQTHYVNSNEQTIMAQVSEGITVRLYKGSNPEPLETLTGLASYPVEFTYLNLEEGLNAYRITATDSLGNVSEKSVKYFLDTAVPGLEVVPSGVVHVNALAQSIFVYAEEGTIVNLYRSGSMETPLASATGLGMMTKFPFVLNDLTEGTNSYVIVATDAAFNVSSAPATFEVDTVPPAIPLVTAPTNNSTVNVNKPSFTGTAEIGSIVKIAVDEEQNEYSAYVDSMGNWSYTSLTVLSEGPHKFMVKAIDAAGNTASVPNWVSFIVDTAAPNVPTVLTPANGALVNTSQLTIGGSTDMGSAVTITLDGTNYAAAVDGSGSWSYTPTALGEGSHSFTVIATDAAGNVSASTSAIGFTVDTTPPAVPTVTAPANGALVNTSQLTIGGSTDMGSAVTITLDGTNYAAAVDGSGSWSYTPTALGEGSHSFTVKATDAAGNISASTSAIGFTVDRTPPAVPVVTAPSNNTTVIGKRPVIHGTTEVGSSVTIKLDGIDVSATVDGSGNWSYAPTADLAEGLHTFKVKATDAAGNASADSSEYSFTAAVPEVELIGPSGARIGVPFGIEVALNNFDKLYAIEIHLEYTNAEIYEYAEPGYLIESIFDNPDTSVSEHSEMLDSGTGTFTYVATQFSNGTTPVANIPAFTEQRQLFALALSSEAMAPVTVRIKRVIVVDKDANVVGDSEQSATLKLVNPEITFNTIGGV